MIGGIAIFVAIIVVVLIPGWLNQDYVADGQAALTDSEHRAGISTRSPNTPGASTPSAPAAKVQALSQEQQKILDTLALKFPELLPGLAKEVSDDQLFLAAAEQAAYKNPVFQDYGLDITLLLPDPRADSLDRLGIAQYTPHSGAQAYISENYAKLCRMDTADRIEIPVTLYYQTGIGGEKTLDWSLSGVFGGLNEYMNVFLPHAGQYMADKGFNDAAAELMMPDIGSWDSAEGKNPVWLEQYFTDLADALAFKGIEINGQTVVDREKIEQALKTRLAETWVCDSVAVVNYDNSSPTPYIRVRSLAPVAFFNRVYEGLDARYKSGTLTPPSSLDEFEAVYRAAARDMSAGVLASSAAKNQELIYDREYLFDWETLGQEGISACPELVETSRGFLSSYDFYLLFTYHPFL